VSHGEAGENVFDEQVIDIMLGWVGVVHIGCYPRPCGAYGALDQGDRCRGPSGRYDQ
jgi:hypothetical protein